jgi:hypothetical protein
LFTVYVFDLNSFEYLMVSVHYLVCSIGMDCLSTKWYDKSSWLPTQLLVPWFEGEKGPVPGVNLRFAYGFWQSREHYGSKAQRQ